MNIVQVLLIYFAASLAAPPASEVVVVVSVRSSLQGLSREQLVDAFLGRRTQLPGGQRLVPIDLAESMPQRFEFYERHAGMTPVELKMHWSKLIFTGRGQPPRSVSDASALKAALAANPDAIGYLEYGAVDASLRMLTID